MKLATRTYGTLHFEAGKGRYLQGVSYWVIRAEPHVGLRLKRLMQRSGRQYEEIRLQATEEVSRDLLWFIDRYPLEMSLSDRRRLGKLARRFAERVRGYALLLDGTTQPRDFDLAIPPRDYQRVAAELWLQSGGLLLADELGLGKTCVALCGLALAELRPALVVVPTHLQFQWAAELARFVPGLKAHILKTGKPYDLTAPPKGRRKVPENQGEMFDEQLRYPDVIISTYYKLDGWAETLAPQLNSVVFDEVQELRRPDSNKNRAARLLGLNRTTLLEKIKKKGLEHRSEPPH